MQATLTLAHRLGFEAAVTITRDVDVDGADLVITFFDQGVVAVANTGVLDEVGDSLLVGEQR